MPVDARRMGLDRSRLTASTSTIGIGGICEGFDALAMILVKDEELGTLFEFRATIFIPDETEAMLEIDGSVLGRDVLDCGKLIYDGFGKAISFEVMNPYAKHAVPGGW